MFGMLSIRMLSERMIQPALDETNLGKLFRETLGQVS